MFVELLLFPLKGIPHVKYEKKRMDNAHFFTFFTRLDLIWPKFCAKTTQNLSFIAGFRWNMLGDSININKLNWNPLAIKNIEKTSRNYYCKFKFSMQILKKLLCSLSKIMNNKHVLVYGLLKSNDLKRIFVGHIHFKKLLKF